MKPKMICDDCFHKDVCRLDGNEILEWCSAMVPSADVVEVVRCKDCKYCLSYPDVISGFHMECCHDEMPGSINISRDFFCSYGERKETNG